MDVLNPYVLAEQANEAKTLYRLTDRLYRARSERDVYDAALDAIVGALGCSRASILLFDKGGVMRFVAWRGLSDDYRKSVEGHSPWKQGQRDPEPIFVPNVTDADQRPEIIQALKSERIQALGFIPLVVHGGTVGKFMIYYDAPRTLEQHEIDLAVTIGRQVGFSLERAQSDQAREESEERFHQMSEHAPVMIWMSDHNGKCLHLNKLLRDFWGVSEENIATFDWSTTMHPEDAPRIGAAMMNAIANREGVSVKGRYRDQNGRYRVLQTNARTRMSNGEFLGLIGVNIDITEREEADEARRQAETHRELLIAELDHRVKNTLTVVLAIARQTFKEVEEDKYASFTGRLRALAKSHDLLTQGHWQSVSLHDLAENTVRSPNNTKTRISLNGPPVLLPPREAVSLGMAMHELLTNALKYGALSNDEGVIALEWDYLQSDQRLSMTWRETGGPPVLTPQRKGFGSALIQRALKYEMGADVDLLYLPEGVTCRIGARLNYEQEQNGET